MSMHLNHSFPLYAYLTLMVEEEDSLGSQEANVAKGDLTISDNNTSKLTASWKKGGKAKPVSDDCVGGAPR